MSKEMDVKLVSMNKSHVDMVFAIEEECFVTPWSKNSIYKELDNPLAHYYVIFLEDEAIGYGGFWTIVDEANINNIAVKPKYRGLGLGNIIVEQIINRAKDLSMKNIILEVRSSNYTAQGLYKKYGFKMVGLRKNYYQDIIEDAIIMEKVI